MRKNPWNGNLPAPVISPGSRARAAQREAHVATVGSLASGIRVGRSRGMTRPHNKAVAVAPFQVTIGVVRHKAKIPLFRVISKFKYFEAFARRKSVE
jgi:hypothetical protein